MDRILHPQVHTLKIKKISYYLQHPVYNAKHIK